MLVHHRLPPLMVPIYTLGARETSTVKRLVQGHIETECDLAKIQTRTSRPKVWHSTTTPPLSTQLQTLYMRSSNVPHSCFYHMPRLDQSRFCGKQSKNHIGDQEVANNHTWWSISWTSLKPISYSAKQLYSTISTKLLPLSSVQSNRAVFSESHGSITRLHCDRFRWTSVTSCVLLERPTTDRSDVIAPVCLTSSWHCRVIAPNWRNIIGTSRPNFGKSWISELNFRDDSS
jgi:hypothetical protein